FFQAEDGIRDRNVTGVQTCALPICCSCPLAQLPLQVTQGGIGVAAGHGDGIHEEVPFLACGSGPDGPGNPTSVRSWGTGTVRGEIGRASCRERLEGARETGGGVETR